MKRRLICCVAIALGWAGIAGANLALGVAAEPITKLVASDAGAGDAFGVSVDVSGDIAVIGAYLDDDKGNNAGAAYVFVRSGAIWMQQAKLVAADGAAGDNFGAAVGVRGDTIVVGAPFHDGAGADAGAAYVYVRSGQTWEQQSKLTGSASAAGDWLGVAVGVSVDLAVVSAPRGDDTRGVAYVFRRIGSIWTEEEKLVASDAAAGDRFGSSAAITTGVGTTAYWCCGDRVVIGAPGSDEGGVDAGAAYVFRRVHTSPANTVPVTLGWIEQAKLTAFDRAAGDLFGVAVAIAPVSSDVTAIDWPGNTAVVGADGDDDKGSNSGSAYVFTEGGAGFQSTPSTPQVGSWHGTAKILASDGQASDFFGGSVALAGDSALVGARGDDDRGDGAGAAYLFRRSGTAWSEQAKLLAFDGAGSDEYSGSTYGIGGSELLGFGVAMDTDAGIVGASGDDDTGGDSGSAYVFELEMYGLNLEASVGLVDPSQGQWHLRNAAGGITSFFYGDPGDAPFVGDWDCSGTETPGLFRTSNGYVYLRNSNSVGIADIRFLFGNPGDIPLAGDFDGDGCDSVSIYRPAEQRFYVVNELGENEGGLGPAEFSFVFGNPGDKPVVGDWDDDGIDEVGLHRESTGVFYWRDTLDTGVASGEIFFGDPGDRFVAGDWGVVDGADTPAVFRPSNATFFFRYTLIQGVADSQFVFGEAGWLPVAGELGLD